ncbi:MAG: carboxypeptidase-like regulatory domain-containing protein [Ferruginibacter sp.]
MKQLIITTLLLGFLSVRAQVKISGRIADNKNKPLAGASIALKNTYDGSTSDSAGNYVFTTMEKGARQVDVTITGYNPISQNITVGTEPMVLNVSLKEQITEMKAVVISAGAFEASDKNKGAVLNSIDIVTTPSANGDITSAFKSLPGTQQVGESEGLFVRGGTATESKIYMDGNLVNNFFYSSTPGIATRGRFNPFLFKGTVFSTGGYSALYGQALSSALILESTDLPDKTQADLGISVLGLGGGIQHLSKDKKSSGVLPIIPTWDLLFKVIKQKQDFFQVPVVKQPMRISVSRLKMADFFKYYGYLARTRRDSGAGY